MKKLFSMLLVLSVLVSCIGAAFVTEATAASTTERITDDMIVADWLFGETVYYRDAESIMSEYSEAGITDVYLLAKGTGGRLAWQSKVSGTEMSYGNRDIIKETCDAAKKYGIRVHAWMCVGQDGVYSVRNTNAIAYHFRVGTSDSLVRNMDLNSSDYKSYMRSLIKELNEYDLAGIHFDYIRYGNLFYGWGASDRANLINNYGITKAEYNAAVKAMCVTASEEYGSTYYLSTNSDGYYVYSSSGSSASGVNFAEAMVGQGSTDAKNGTLKVAQMRKDLVKNFIAEVTQDLDSDKLISCAIMPEAVDDYAAKAYYCQDPAVMKDVVDYVAIMSYASQYGGANTWPASLAKQCASVGCNAVPAVQTFDCENSNADPTCSDIYNEFYNVVSAMNSVNSDSSYSGKILGAAFFRAAKMTLAGAYIKDSSTMTINVHQQDETQAGVTKLVFTMKNGVKISGISNKSGWGSSTFTISSDKTTLTITNSSGILSSYGSASFDVSYTGTINEKTGACSLTAYKSSGENYAFCSTVFPKHTHAYTSKITTASTCVKAGVKTYTCACGDTYTETLPLIDHIYNSTVTTDPTCSAIGIRLYKCTMCSSSYTEELPKVAHKYSEQYDEATGTTTFTCDNCGNSFQSSCGFTHERVETWAVEGNTHFAFCYGCNVYLTYSCHFVETARTNATCTTDGSVTYICGGHTDTHTGQLIKDAFSGEGCTNTYTEVLPASCDFSYVSNLDSTHQRVCNECGKTEAPTDCTFVDGSCSVCNYSVKDFTTLHFRAGSAETGWNWEFYNSGNAVSFGSESYGSMKGISSDTNGNPYFLIWPQDPCAISHTVAENDVVELRIRLNVTSNPGGYTTCNPDVRLQTGNSAYSSLTGNSKATTTLSLTTNDWQIVQIPIVGKVYSEGYVINRILVDPWNTLMYLGAEIEIDYIYIGQPEKAPSASPNNLFFDFTNSDRAANRYNGNNYEGYKFDVISWGYDKTLSARPTFDRTAEGSLVIGSITGSSAYAQTIPNYANLPATPLEYTTQAGDIVEMRFKTEGLTAASGATPSVSLYYDLNNAGTCSNKFSFSCTSATILGGEYVTVRANVAAGQLISSLRPQIDGIKSTGNGKFIIDYIYVGKESGAPSANADILYFDFSDDEDARNRYDSYSYGYYNYDVGGWDANTLRNSAPTFANGTMSTTVVGESPYLQINAGTSNLDSQPLNFNPANVDMVQVRVKLENLERSSEYNAPAFVFKFMTDDDTQATTNSYMTHKLTSAQLTSGEYMTLSMPVGDFFENASKLTTLQVSVANAKPIAGKTAKITIDYIYVGPQKDDVKFVYFYNSTGTYCLEVSYSDNGSAPSYNGDIPMMEPAAQYHYEFSGWVDVNGNEVNLNTAKFTKDTNLYASYAQVSHTYTYTGDAEGHIGTCSCGVPTAKSAHNWDNGTITTPATCNGAGIITYTCKTCSFTRDESYAATGHSYTSVVTAPTCTAQGYTTHTCACGDSYVDSYVLAKGHNYSTTVTNATCTTDGYTTHLCANCGDTYTTDYIQASGHNYQSVVTAPTCTTDGKTVYTCSKCGDSYTETQAATGHALVYNAKANATCTEAGTAAHYHCNNCGGNYIDENGTYAVPDSYLYVAALGHSVSYYADKDATCEENGYYAHYKCSRCSTCFVDADCRYSVPETYLLISATGHNYSYINNGSNHSIYCANCQTSILADHSYTDGTCICGAIEVVGPKYVLNTNLTFSSSISIGAEMQVIYSIPLAKVKSYTSFYLEVVKEVYGAESVTTVYNLESNNLTANTHPVTGATLGYNATYSGIFASEMGDNFTATLYAVAEDGTIYYGNPVTSSIKSSLFEKLNDAKSSAELKTLAVDMLNYGAAAQRNFGYNVNNLVNADLTAAQKALGTQTLPTAVDSSSTTGSGCTIRTSVSLQSKVTLYINCVYTTNENSRLAFIIKDKNGKVLDVFSPTTQSGKVCQGIYTNVGAAQMRDPITIGLYDNGKLVSKLITWNIESYVAQTRASASSSSELIDIVNAMLVYGDSAARYFG